MPRALRLALCFELAAGAPLEWVELIPAPDAAARIVGRDGRSFLWDDLARTTVLAAHARNAVALPIDINHSTERAAPNGGESPAAAWIEQLEMRAGALWGRVTWTPRGEAALAAREYRYLSPVFEFDPQTGRIARLCNAALTNTPNLHLQALNSEESTMERSVLLAVAIVSALGLTVTATDDEIAVAVNALKTDRDTAVARAQNAQQPSLDKFVPRADYEAMRVRAENAEQKIATSTKTAHETAVNAEIDAALRAGKIAPASVDYHRAACSDDAGLARFRAFAAAAPVIAGDSGLEAKKPPGTSTALNAEELEACKAMGMSHEQYIAERDALKRAAA